MKKSNNRMIAPDIMKILACIFVVVIHHKAYRWETYNAENIGIHTMLFIVCACVGFVSFLKERKKGISFCFSLNKFVLPMLVFFAYWLFKKFPVTVFIILSSYFMGKSLMKTEKPVNDWYKASNVIPRILRFYLPFIPIFVLCILYKIFVLGYQYTPLEAAARFILGGFKPGSYYLPILAQLVLIFPVIYTLVVKFRVKSVIAFVIGTFVYDYLAANLGMSDIAYKFIIFRFAAHIALGAYASVTEFTLSKKTGFTMLGIGFIYSFLCVYTSKWTPSIFFQWQETSFVTAIYLYPVICFVMNRYRHCCYGTGKLSSVISAFAGATYHIFLVQLMFYTTFGFSLNEYIANYYVNMLVNLSLTIIPGIIYAHYSIPIENKLISKLKYKLQK